MILEGTVRKEAALAANMKCIAITTNYERGALRKTSGNRVIGSYDQLSLEFMRGI